MSLLGRIEPFNIKDDNWEDYWEMMRQYLVANNVDGNAKRTATFLTLIGKETYGLMNSLVAPAKPSSMKVEELNTILDNHLKPTPIVIAERCKFYSRTQGETETIAEYIAELRKLSIHCEFEGFLDEGLRDKLVCGIHTAGIRKKLLTEKKLTLQKAVELAKSMERADTESKSMESVSEVHVNALTYQGKKRRCYRCDAESHLANVCRHKESICNKCNLKGHLAEVCRSRGKSFEVTSGNNEYKGGNKRYGNTSVAVHHKDNQYDERESDDEEEIYYIKKMQTKDSLEIAMKVNGKEMEFEIDTGSGLTIISETTYKRHFADKVLQRSKVIVKTYSEERLGVLGKNDTMVEYQGKSYGGLKLYVIKGDGVNLLGRSWLAKIQLDWQSIFKKDRSRIYYTKILSGATGAEKIRLDELIKKYASIFTDGLGTIKDFKANQRKK